MIDKNLNFSKLISNYLFCKSIDDFLSNENGFYDVSNLGLLKSLIENIKLIQNDAYVNIRFKIAFSYLINQYGAFFKNTNEESFISVIGTLFNENLSRFISVNILEEIKKITLRKASVLLKEKFFDIHVEKVEDLIQNDSNFFNDTNQNEAYPNEAFYNDLSKIFSQPEFKNTSIIFEITNFHDLKNENEEENLVIKLQSLKNGSDRFVSPSERSKPELESSIQKKTTINSDNDELMNIRYNDDEERPVSPVIGIQNRISCALEEPTASKLRATRVSSIEPNNIQQNLTQFQEDSDDELNFNLTTSAKQTRVSKDLAVERSNTSSPKPTSSRLANKESAFPNDSDSSVEFRKKTRKKSSKNYESSSREESAHKSRRSIKKKARVENSSELSSIDADSDLDIKKKSPRETKNGGAHKQRSRWTDEETIYLAIGVELYGKGNWAKILKRFNEQLKERNSVHLKDKYRNLERTDEIKRVSKKAKCYIQKYNYKI